MAQLQQHLHDEHHCQTPSRPGSLAAGIDFGTYRLQLHSDDQSRTPRELRLFETEAGLFALAQLDGPQPLRRWSDWLVRRHHT